MPARPPPPPSHNYHTNYNVHHMVLLVLYLHTLVENGELLNGHVHHMVLLVLYLHTLVENGELLNGLTHRRTHRHSEIETQVLSLY
jgi:hypothetical protein